MRWTQNAKIRKSFNSFLTSIQPANPSWAKNARGPYPPRLIGSKKPTLLANSYKKNKKTPSMRNVVLMSVELG